MAKNNKKIYLSTFIFLITILLIMLAMYYLYNYLRKQQKINELNQVESTGAITFTSPDQATSYEEYFTLYSRGEVVTNDFTLRPIDDDSRFAVILKSHDRKKQFESWLKENGYSHIPLDKFVFDN